MVSSILIGCLDSKYDALFTSWLFFSKWPPMKVVLMFYAFDEIKQMEKNALIQSPKTYSQGGRGNFT